MYMKKIGFPISTKENERRRALLPSDLTFIRNVRSLVFEKGYGNVIGFTDDDYIKAGTTVANRDKVCECPVICNPKPVITDEYFKHGKTLFGWIHAVQGRAITDLLAQNKMTAIAWEDMFDQGRHCFWCNNEISGEAAVMHAALHWGYRPFAKNAAVIGRGNVARGAIRMLERLGCNVIVYDRKTSPLIRREIELYDIIVNAVLWDVFRTDHLIYESDLEKMKKGAIIIDISCDPAMGIESSQPTTIDNPVYCKKGIFHYAVDHTPALFYKSASESISSILHSFIDFLVEDKPNPVIQQATVIKDGNILDQKIIRFQNRC
jgi:N5-(carboxyethyl)ornithine synthase